MSIKPKSNLIFDLMRVTEEAAIGAYDWIGRGDKNAGDGGAVDAMRKAFNDIDIDGIVVIGEGEKDEAPALYNGEKVGTGKGPAMDIAIDPVEGTNLLATGRPNSISVVSMAPKGSMFDPGPAFYMKKLVVGHEARNVIDLDASPTENIKKVAGALGKDVREVVIYMLDKPRHKDIIAEIRKLGASIQLHTDGDVAGALMAVSPNSEVDIMMGTGGTPEGVLAATAIKITGGQILSKLDPQKDDEKKNLADAGFDLNKIYGVDDLVTSDDIFFAATGITHGTFLGGVKKTASGFHTHSMIYNGLTKDIRFIETFHSK